MSRSEVSTIFRESDDSGTSEALYSIVNSETNSIKLCLTCIAEENVQRKLDEEGEVYIVGRRDRERLHK